MATLPSLWLRQSVPPVARQPARRSPCWLQGASTDRSDPSGVPSPPLPSGPRRMPLLLLADQSGAENRPPGLLARGLDRSEEDTSELQSRQYLVCRLLLEKKE